ncbi:type II toxin-antitoxin system Phd/YefM family antitoxin [Limosilactobacillus reuteri]|uniref:type II toxin-antitoxin system Phd/YefM family antitoxin n=1 Tax=Limosilactobacillus reuteri TaxID=1598 RepID=UPI001F0D4BEB|nr:type II toxin-antitoxin system Phd/YefM family antitoxin [Limosilactobacillus reuteri]MCH5357587.1 type II toxin-antitoxin system Phd/YefM family antitoxin [Limosilactobacillus reuteri]
MVQAVTTKDFRRLFKKYADDVANYNEAIIVARPEKKNVVISEKEYNSWQETNYLLKSKANQEALAHSINQLDDSTKHHFLTPEEFERMAAANDQA